MVVAFRIRAKKSFAEPLALSRVRSVDGQPDKCDGQKPQRRKRPALQVATSTRRFCSAFLGLRAMAGPLAAFDAVHLEFV
jgi:hypothetical protein